MRFRKKYDRPGQHYDFRDRRCIEAACWSPGIYAHRGATLSGSRDTGNRSRTCMRRAYHGCPADPGYDVALARVRSREGWGPVR